MMCMMGHSMDHAKHDARSQAAPQDESLLDILKRRYALGEITLEQFEQMKQVLGIGEGARAEAPSSHHQHG